MQDRIFDIVENNLVINANVLLIPRLKALVDKYEQPIQALAYCYFFVSPHSPYSEYDHDYKEEKLLEDYPGDYKVTDKEIANAINELESLYNTTTIRFYKANKKAVDKLSTYLETVLVDDSKETGNIQHVMKLVEKCGTTIGQFRKLEKEKDEEILKTRGDKLMAYDLK